MTAAAGSSVVLTERMTLPESGRQVLIVTLNRPSKKNCFNTRLCHELAAVFRDAADEVDGYDAAAPASPDGDDDDNDEGDGGHEKLAAIILTGAGRSFCAGADLSDPPSPLDQSSDLPHHLRCNPVHQMGRVGVPIIGALRGHVSLVFSFASVHRLVALASHSHALISA